MRERSLLGGFLILMGAMIVMAAFGVGPMSGAQMHAPRWVVGLAGLVFASGGVAAIVTTRGILNLVAGIVVGGLTVICAWVALFGDAKYFSGSPSLFSQATEVLIARVVFGLVALMGAAIFANAARKGFGVREKKR